MAKNEVSKQLLEKIQQANLTPEQWKEFAETLVEDFDHRIESLKKSKQEFDDADNREAVLRTSARQDELSRTLNIAVNLFPQHS